MLIIVNIFIVLVMILLGAFFSGSETGLYRLSRFHLRLGLERKKPSYDLLKKLMEDSQAVVFSVLIGNNLVNYIATSVMTLLILKATQNEHTAQVYATITMTPVLFIFSEVVPKNIFYFRVNALMPKMSPLLWFFHKIFTRTGLVQLLKYFSACLQYFVGPGVQASLLYQDKQRQYIQELIFEIHEEGVLSYAQNELMTRLVNISHIALSSAVKPLTHVVMLDIRTDSSALMAVMKQYAYSKYPVYQGSRNKILGYIDIYEVLSSNQEFDTLSDFIQPLSRYAANTSIAEALDKMMQNKESISLVTAYPDSLRRVLGIVTDKDLINEITGELTP